MTRTAKPGQVTNQTADAMHLAAKLWDFDVDETDPKPNHYAWLDSAIVRVNASSRSFIWYVSVTGMASLTGMNVEPNNAHNWKLARDRANAVDGYLKSNLKAPGLVFNPPFNASTLFAEAAHHPIGVENDADRGIFVMITSDSDPPPPPIRGTPIPVSRDWGIRYSSGGNVSIVLGVDSALFDIADTKNHLHSYYEYSGATIGWSPSILVPLSLTGAGDWTTFQTTGDLNVADFDGACRFTTAGGGPLSANYLTLTPAGGVTTVGGALSIDTGFTFGAGASVTLPDTGWLHLKTRHPFPYTGSFPP